MTDFLNLILGDKSKLISNKHITMLRLIWLKGLSRKELAKELELSKVIVLRRVEELIKWGIVEENGQAVSQTRGRRPIPLALNRKLFYSVGISLLAEGTANVNISNARSEIISEILLKDLPLNWQEKCDYIIDKTKKIIEELEISFDKVIGTGIALTGIVNPSTGIVASSSQFSKDKNFNLLEYFSMRFGKDCFMMNVAHLKAYIEYKWGKAKDMSSFLCFHSGFGLGMFLNGSLYFGHQYHGGEAGSMQIDSHGTRGVDGRVGTLDQIAPFHKITSKVNEIIDNGGKTEVRKYLSEDNPKVNLQMIVNAIEDGDQLCAQMMSESFEVIGRVIVNLAYIFNPEAIFLPKWTIRCPEVSLDVVKRMMGHYGVSNWELKTDIHSAKCGNEDLARGAALLPAENIFGNQL
jgi:N-acetylglucosamine repressor